MDKMSHVMAPDGISLDFVAGINSEGKLRTDTTITFYIHIKNTDYTPRFALQTGFRIWSPDGASWNSISADTVALPGGSWADMFEFGFFIDSFGCDGYDADTVSFGGMAFYNGLPATFDETSYAITIGPIDEYMEGRTICIDSSFFPPAGGWLWVDENGVTSRPPWGGPYCFTIGGLSTISYSGYLYYLDPVPPGANPMPMRGITIKMCDADFFEDDTLGITTTGMDGYFAFDPVENNDGLGSGTLDIYFVISAENEAAYITNQYNGNIYKLITPIQQDVASGNYDTTIVAPADASGCFFIADAALYGHDIWKSIANYNVGQVQIASTSTGDTGSFYSDSLNYIAIQKSITNLFYWPDIYDKSIILEEYSHYIEYLFDFFDNSQKLSHVWWDTISVELAATEGFASFMAGVFQEDSILLNYGEDFLVWCWRNLENGEIGFSNDPDYYTANNFGAKCEGAVAGILWDIYDYANDDYSSFPPSYGPEPDGIEDTLWDGPGDILNVLIYRTIDDDYPDDINEFWDAWFQAPSKGHPVAMRDIWYEHGVLEYLCGDANDDWDVNVADAVFLINYIFREGPAPNPLESGNVNGDILVNVGDVVYLISYIYRGGDPPCSW